MDRILVVLELETGEKLVEHIKCFAQQKLKDLGLACEFVVQTHLLDSDAKDFADMVVEIDERAEEITASWGQEGCAYSACVYATTRSMFISETGKPPYSADVFLSVVRTGSYVVDRIDVPAFDRMTPEYAKALYASGVSEAESVLEPRFGEAEEVTVARYVAGATLEAFADYTAFLNCWLN